MSDDYPPNIYNDTQYLEFKYSFNLIGVFTLISYFYMSYGFWIVLRIIRINNHTTLANNSIRIHTHLIIPFVFMQVMNLLHFIFEHFSNRIPSTGFLTSILAKIPPNHFFGMITVSKLILGYSKMYFSLLFCTIRLLTLIIPVYCKRVCNILNIIFIPISLIVPIGLTCTFFEFSGFFVQLNAPYSFGQVALRITEIQDDSPTSHSYRNDMLTRFRLAHYFIIPIAIFLINTYIIYKIRIFYIKSRSVSASKNFKADVSLAITTAAIILPFLDDGIWTIALYCNIQRGIYYDFVRYPINDLCKLMIPILLYWTHPVFNLNRSNNVLYVD